MTRDLHRLRKLQGITDAVLLAQQSRLASITAEERRLKTLLADLEAARADRAEALRTEPDPAARAGADPRWQLWAEARRRALNQDLARLRVRREDIMSDLTRAFGRNHVSEKLVKAARLSRQEALRRRADYTS